MIVSMTGKISKRESSYVGLMGSHGLEASTLIPFCMRLIEPNKDDDDKNKTIANGTPFTFERLKQLNVTSKDLLQWSASLDIIEKYEIYLAESSSSSNPASLQIYHNCTQLWFGKLCEYTFDSRFKSFSSFSDIVNFIYEMKLSPELGKQRVLRILEIFVKIKLKEASGHNRVVKWTEE
ncbi:unnamed protein product [Didymodactylos carnosus]|uniref:Uncharacterized protein n=1 Tax=Didymodactylos carnosus TaxID=1234261 RepID=A0A8S2SQ47_9BILA|nr:unnamed protein product [Didymodactylos carnosus]CAF4234389.1 unnamed protein product [Didymodactylos carnosus]